MTSYFPQSPEQSFVTSSVNGSGHATAGVPANGFCLRELDAVLTWDCDLQS